MSKESTLQWHKVDEDIENLDIDIEHKIVVQREAIPLIFVPGIMGSVLRRTGTNGTGNGDDGLPNLRWDPSGKSFMMKYYGGESGAHRRNMLIGPNSYNKNYLEVNNNEPVGNGFEGVSSDSYHDFLHFLENSDTWGPLKKIFDLPVYAIGYNWTDTNKNNGILLAKRIDEIIKEAKNKTGKCEKVIVITHSMGGLVSRAASELSSANSKIMGIIHGVQPATGAAAAYWRIKAGFEGWNMASWALGNSGPTVTPILGNMPGGLELLPNKNYTNNDGNHEWLKVRTEDYEEILSLPKKNPYDEIYRIKGTGSEVSHPKRKYWGLVDPDLLNPNNNQAPNSLDEDDPDALDSSAQLSEWEQYLELLKNAESFHNTLGKKVHPFTYTFHGTNNTTAENIIMETETIWIEKEPYLKRGFRGRFINSEGKPRRAILQDPIGIGDGTVPISSASSLDDLAQSPPAPLGTPGEHEPIYKSEASHDFVVRTISTLCKKLYEKNRGKKIN